MKVNYKVRFKNPVFYVQILIAVFGPVLVYYGVTPAEVTTFPLLIELIQDAFSNPFVLGTMITGFYVAVTDPTTPGNGDSLRALGYDKPPKDIRFKGGK